MSDRYDHELLLAYIEGELDAQRARALEAELADDAKLCALIEQLRADRQAVRAMGEQEPPGPLTEDAIAQLERRMLLDAPHRTAPAGAPLAAGGGGGRTAGAGRRLRRVLVYSSVAAAVGISALVVAITLVDRTAQHEVQRYGEMAQRYRQSNGGAAGDADAAREADGAIAAAQPADATPASDADASALAAADDTQAEAQVRAGGGVDTAANRLARVEAVARALAEADETAADGRSGGGGRTVRLDRDPESPGVEWFGQRSPELAGEVGPLGDADPAAPQRARFGTPRAAGDDAVAGAGDGDDGLPHALAPHVLTLPTARTADARPARLSRERESVELLAGEADMLMRDAVEARADAAGTAGTAGANVTMAWRLVVDDVERVEGELMRWVMGRGPAVALLPGMPRQTEPVGEEATRGVGGDLADVGQALMLRASEAEAGSNLALDVDAAGVARVAGAGGRRVVVLAGREQVPGLLAHLYSLGDVTPTAAPMVWGLDLHVAPPAVEGRSRPIADWFRLHLRGGRGDDELMVDAPAEDGTRWRVVVEIVAGEGR